MFNAALLFTLALQMGSRCNSVFLQQAWSLLEGAEFGRSDIEQAAFAVLDDDGPIRFIRWPATTTPLHSEYRGVIPANTFAVVHTHPNTRPGPSADDAALARRLGVPVYVLTRTMLCRTTGQRTEYLRLGDWNPERCR
jgi:hypothetical protein